MDNTNLYDLISPPNIEENDAGAAEKNYKTIDVENIVDKGHSETVRIGVLGPQKICFVFFQAEHADLEYEGHDDDVD